MFLTLPANITDMAIKKAGSDYYCDSLPAEPSILDANDGAQHPFVMRANQRSKMISLDGPAALTLLTFS